MSRISILSCLIGAGVLLSSPIIAWSQGDGPIQRESAGAGGGSGVDEFAGAFGYTIPVLSIPGPSGSGYTVNLSYRSGEPFNGASWVGYGWNLGPGGIIRDKRGFPDDWSHTVRYWNKNKV